MPTSQLQIVEGHCKQLCLALHQWEAQHLPLDNDERRKQLVRMTITCLQKLLDGSLDTHATLPRPTYEAGPGSPSNALSLEASRLSAQDRAANALAHRMGAYVPPELR